MRTILMTLPLALLNACRTEKSADDYHVGGGDFINAGQVDNESVLESDDEQGAIVKEAPVTQVEIPSKQPEPCPYVLYVVGRSQEAMDAGIEQGWQCFPTKPTLSLLEHGGWTASTDADHLGFGWSISAAPEGPVFIDSVYGSVELLDNNGGGWSESFSSLEGTVSHLRTYGYDSDDWDDYDWRYLGNNLPFRSSEGFTADIGAWGDFEPLYVAPSGHGAIWLSIDFTEPFVAGDGVAIEMYPSVAWHAPNVPMVITTENPEYQAGDNYYLVSFE